MDDEADLALQPCRLHGRVKTWIGVPFAEYADLSRLTMADMVNQSARLLRPLVDALERHVMAGERARRAGARAWPGSTRTARLWVYVRDDRPFAAPDPAAVFCRYTSDREGNYPRAHPSEFREILQMPAMPDVPSSMERTVSF